MQKLVTQQKKTEEGNKNGIKHSWPRKTCVMEIEMEILWLPVLMSAKFQANF